MVMFVKKKKKNSAWFSGLCTSALRKLRVVVQELKQDDVEVVTPHPELQHVDTSETKAQIGQMGRLNVRSTAQKNCNYKRMCPAKDFVYHCGFSSI